MSDKQHSASRQQTIGGGGELGSETAGEPGDLELDPAALEAPSGKRPTGVLVMLLVVGLAIGTLFSMRQLTKVSGSSGKNPKIESVVEDFLTAMGKGGGNPGGEDDPSAIGDYNDVVHVLTDNYTKNQVTDLGRNPFLSIDDGTLIVATGTGNQIQRAADKLQLKSVMGNSIANINGRIVRTGQVFPVDLGKGEGTVDFMLVGVGPDSATVEAVGGDAGHAFERTLYLRRNN